MFKKSKRLIGLCLGVVLSLGVGVGLGTTHDEAVGVRAATVSTSYTINTTAATDIVDGSLYILKEGSNGFNGTISSDWGSVTTTKADYFILKAAGNSTSFTLEDYDGTKGYLYCSKVKKIAWSTKADNRTSFALRDGIKNTSLSNAIGNTTIGTLQSGTSSNKTYIRPYTSSTGNEYQLFLLTPISTGDSSLVSISVSGYTANYYTDDEFSFDGKCTANFEDGSSRLVTPTSVSEPDMSTIGTKTITVSFTDPNDETNIQTAEYTINVTQYPYEGRGTEASPYTVSDAYSIASELSKGANNGKIVYVKGVISTKSFSVSNSKATFDITDGVKTLNAYSISGVTNDSAKSNYVAYDYRVVVSGALINYNGTLEVGYASGYSSSLSTSKAPASLTLNVPETLEFDAEGTFTATTDGTNPVIKWSSSNEDLCLIDDDGSYLAGTTTGKVTITASLTYDDCIIPVEKSKEIEIVNPNLHTVTLTGDSTVKVGKTIQLTAKCSKGDEITWTSSSVENATVSDTGLVTGVAEGSTTITAKCANGDEATKVITIEPKDILFKKVNSYSDLTFGKEIMIANKDGTKVMSTTQNTNNRGMVNATLDGENIKKASTTAVFKLLPAKNNGYAFYDATAEKMLSTASSSDNYLKTNGSYGNENAYATISFTTNSDKSITTSVKFQGSYTRNVLQYNSGSSLFSCYSSNSQQAISIYIAVEGESESIGDTWAKQFNTSANCDPTGARTLSSDTWSTLKTEFNNQSIPEKMAASYLDVDSSVATTDFVNAINSYEHCLTKYGYTGFINDRGTTTNNASNLIYRTTDNNTAILIVVIVSFASVTAIGGYFFIRKRKYN